MMTKRIEDMNAKELLETVKIGIEENQKLIAENEKEKLKTEEFVRWVDRLINEQKRLIAERFRQYNDEEYIIFFDDGEDYPDSMVCPVVMSADKFRELFYARDQVKQLTERAEKAEAELLEAHGWIARAMMKGCCEEDVTKEALQKIIAKHNLEQQIKGVMRVMACRELNLSEGDIDTLILIKENLRKQAQEQDSD